jgi:hypothetical protein
MIKFGFSFFAAFFTMHFLCAECDLSDVAPFSGRVSHLRFFSNRAAYSGWTNAMLRAVVSPAKGYYENLSRIRRALLELTFNNDFENNYFGIADKRAAVARDLLTVLHGDEIGTVKVVSCGDDAFAVVFDAGHFIYLTSDGKVQQGYSNPTFGEIDEWKVISSPKVEYTLANTRAFHP